uniref:WGS project CAEQ00000000 data, annotated contig 583 n=1 Tax=Trypanosoma congolense (strain IL3000) TaxID=1068625 RepID=F9WH19_TRYCI|nr:unnamed protein product [Trypanosoma congolense IL3000]
MGGLSFAPCVEDDLLNPRHRDAGANALAEARRLAFLYGRAEEAYDSLRQHAASVGSSSQLQRDWREASIALLSLHGESGASAQRWMESGLLPFPAGEKDFAAVAGMPPWLYHHCMMYWTKLGCAALSQEGALGLTPKGASETLQFVVRDICCVRLAGAPRSIPHWTLLERVLSELLRHSQVPIADACPGLSAAQAMVELMVHYLRLYVVRYLQLRDRPLEGRRGLLHYRGVFDRASEGVNSSCVREAVACRLPTELPEMVLSPKHLLMAVQVLCGCDEAGMHWEKDLSAMVGDDSDVAGNRKLEELLNLYFFSSPPMAFDRLPHQRE